jgi:ribulose-phosphate 3-epimerase
MVIIAPSILAIKQESLINAARMAEGAGADWIHLDLMDGHFVPNLTYGPPIVELIKPASKLPFDAHLMTTDPELWIPALLEIGIEYISVHQEACTHLHRVVSQIRDGGAKAGVALNPATCVETLYEMLPIMDYVLIMAVNPGFAYQKHIEGTADKVARFAHMAREREWKGLIEVDGGITDSNIGSMVIAGADALVAGGSAYRRREKGEPGADSDYATQVKMNIHDLKIACDVAIESGLDPYK